MRTATTDPLATLGRPPEMDPEELADWLTSLDDVADRYGLDVVQQLLATLERHVGGPVARQLTTPYVNTIPADLQPEFPGDAAIERRIRSLVRWNAMAMVVRANRHDPAIGGHIATYASAATLLEIGFNHFFRGPTEDQPGDFLFVQGHATPGVYARAYLQGRLTDEQLERFRREAPRGTGLSSYPHPWLMPNLWQFPTVSMGLASIMAIYQARFLRYLHDRELCDTSGSHVWVLLGDGEMDEPESTGALTVAARERLDNLTFIVNCNLQRLDGPVRGNGKIIQELEALFAGAGWNVIKLIWGSDWDELLAADDQGLLVQRMEETVDGQYQKYSVESGQYIRDHFFGDPPELRALVEHLSDEQLQRLNRGGHDPAKVYAAYLAARQHRGQPSVILAKTIKGYGLSQAEGRNITHKHKVLNEEGLRAFRSRFGIPVDDDQLREVPFYRPPEDSREMRYLRQRTAALGGPLPQRQSPDLPLDIPPLETYATLLRGSDRPASTTMAFGRLLAALLKDALIGERIVPIIPDEARTFGLETLFGRYGIYSSLGQLYEPVDADQLIRYREARDGQILEEGITEAGAMSSFIAAGTAHTNVRFPMIPFYLFYSMFGFQRVGDLIWAAADAQARGFLLGCTAGRTTLSGEGLQHQDGHSQLVASTVPNLQPYDPAYAYEVAVVVQDGLRRMYHEQESTFYYLTLYNETYPMPAMPDGSAEGILRGMYRLDPPAEDERPAPPGDRGFDRPQLLGSGPILEQVRRAAQILADDYEVASDVWSVTSYCLLRREALAAERHNRLHPDAQPRTSYLERCLAGQKGPLVAASDSMKAVPDQIARWVPGAFHVLGTDGFGRSDTRQALREHFEISAEHVVLATLTALARDGRFEQSRLSQAIQRLGIDPEKMDPATA